MDLFNDSVIDLKEVCWHIAMNSRIIGEAAAFERRDMNTLDLVIKFFNTYLRAAINKKVVNTVYVVLYQYRRYEYFKQYLNSILFPF